MCPADENTICNSRTNRDLEASRRLVKNISCYEPETFHVSRQASTITTIYSSPACSRSNRSTLCPTIRQNSNRRLLATGLKLVNLLQSESFCSFVTKYFFLLQKKGKSFTGVVKSFLRNLSSICNEMFEEWIPVRSEMTMFNMAFLIFLCADFSKELVPCGFQIKIADGELNL